MYSSVSNYRNVLTCNEAFGILIMGISLHLYSCGFMNGRLIICCKQPCNNKGWRVLFVVCTKVFRHGSYTCTPCVSGFLVVMQLALINVRNSAHVMTLVYILVYAYVATLRVAALAVGIHMQYLAFSGEDLSTCLLVRDRSCFVQWQISK